MSLQMKVHTKGIRGSGMMKPGEKASALFGGILEINGMKVEEVTDIAFSMAAESFGQVTVTFIPGAFDVIPHDQASWDREFGPSSPQARQAVRDNIGRVIAAMGVG